MGGVNAKPLLRPVETGTSVSTVRVSESVVIDEVVKCVTDCALTKKMP